MVSRGTVTNLFFFIFVGLRFHVFGSLVSQTYAFFNAFNPFTNTVTGAHLGDLQPCKLQGYLPFLQELSFLFHDMSLIQILYLFFFILRVHVYIIQFYISLGQKKKQLRFRLPTDPSFQVPTFIQNFIEIYVEKKSEVTFPQHVRGEIRLHFN